MNENIVVYDIETMINLFTITFYEVSKDEYHQFVIHDELLNESENLYKYLEYLYINNCVLVGFNNYEFDYPVIHYMIDEHVTSSKSIYEKAQFVIDNYFNGIPNWKAYYRQVDLFRINHFNNPARSQSLKGLQINMQLEDVRDMPYKHTHIITTIEEINEVLSYNKWDVYSTYQFYLRNLDKIKLRTELSELYNIDFTNSSDVGIGENLFLKMLSEDMNIGKKELRQYRTHRNKVIFKDIIFDYISYEHDELNKVLKEFKSKTISNTKHGFKKSLKFYNEIYEFGQGGLHMCTKSGIYKSNDEYIIYDIDV